MTGDFAQIRKDFSTLGTHLKNASDRYRDVEEGLSRFGDRLALPLEAPDRPGLPDATDGAGVEGVTQTDRVP